MKSAALSPFLAQHRFGFGAEIGSIDAEADGREILRAALDAPEPEIFRDLPDSAQSMAELNRYRKLSPERKEAEKGEFQRRQREAYGAEMRARLIAALDRRSAFRERLVWFWSNHFTVSLQKGPLHGLVGAFEREAIRPHVAGRFADLLTAVAQHPAMQLYLDNVGSIGPDSLAGRRSERGLNENFARELLELHTLGVEGGYTQSDVIALAKILTGWSVSGTGPDAEEPCRFRFYPRRHEPGPKLLLGRIYQSEDGYSEGLQALRDLASHPATARHVARKLALHFLSDTPDPGSVAYLEHRFRATGGDLTAVSTTLIELDAAAQPVFGKIRPPGEFLVAALKIAGGARAPEIVANSKFALIGTLREMGQPLFDAPSPKGWSDLSADWSGPDAVYQRVMVAHALSRRIAMADAPEALASGIFGSHLSDETSTAIRRAPSASEALALLLAAPEVQRR